MDGEFRMLDSFQIDNGELDGFERHVCFVLGCEWQQVVSCVDQNPDRELNFTVHLANKDRLQAAMDRRKRPCVWRFPHNDVSEDWVFMEVSPIRQEGEA